MPPLAAAAGIALAVASPVAAWRAGSLQVSFHALPSTGSAVQAAPPSQARPQPVLTKPRTSGVAVSSPAAQATITPEALPTPGAGTPPLLAAPPVYAPLTPTKPQAVGDPTSTVEAFYQAVSSHQFGVAASLWSPALKAADPPAVYIDQRFAATQRIGLTGARVLSDQAGTALIYVDVLEVVAGQQREWVGTWQLVQDQSQWLLNNANLSGA
ncbi:MAG TPA: hypothetical protein VIT43_00195 [Candidatus Dormibacteraeota bacterium]